jgi:uncharacterized protein with PQ loop repeat
VFIITLGFRVFLPNLELVVQQSVSKQLSIILYHQFFISSGVYRMFSFLITLSHHIFQIRCADSETRILQSRSAPGSCFPEFVLNWVRVQLTMLPIHGWCHSRFFQAQISSASSQTSLCPGDSHRVRIWSIVLGTPQCGHSH